MRETGTGIMHIMSGGMGGRALSIPAARKHCCAGLLQRCPVVMPPTVTGLAVDTLLKKLYRALKAV
jgi:hypothetical protein